MKKTIKEKQLEFLQGTVDYYSVNPLERRCIDNGACMYSPKSVKKEGKSEGCAIGRHLDSRLAWELDEENSNTDCSVNEEHIFERLPKELQELGKDFLFDVQSFHDIDINWNKHGLSSTGQRVHQEILKRIINEQYVIT